MLLATSMGHLSTRVRDQIGLLCPSPVGWDRLFASDGTGCGVRQFGVVAGKRVVVAGKRRDVGGGGGSGSKGGLAVDDEFVGVGVEPVDRRIGRESVLWVSISIGLLSGSRLAAGSWSARWRHFGQHVEARRFSALTTPGRRHVLCPSPSTRPQTKVIIIHQTHLMATLTVNSHPWFISGVNARAHAPAPENCHPSGRGPQRRVVGSPIDPW